MEVKLLYTYTQCEDDSVLILEVTQTDKMTASHILMAFILCVLAHNVKSQSLRRYHVSNILYVTEEGGTLHALCPPHGAYSSRQWKWNQRLLRPGSDIYTQSSDGSTTTGPGARPDMVLNHTDWSLTISSLQVNDNGRLFCEVSTGGQTLFSITRLVVYNRRVDVRFGTSVTLQCPVDAEVYTSRQWHIRPYSISHLLYNQTASGVTKGSDARNDMSLNTETFELTIGNVRQFDYRLTCTVTSGQGVKTGIIFTAIYSVVVEAEEGESVTLPCDEVQRYTNQGFHNTDSREPYTRPWQRVYGSVLYLQYRFRGVFYEHRHTTRPDITLNNSTFSLTISRTQLTDSSMYICAYNTYGVDYVQSVKLDIYVNPKITLSGLDDTPVSVGSTVTITCTIDRVYPELGPGDFTMRWGTQTFMSTGSQNGDESYRYTVQNVHTVNIMDNGTMVECLVNPIRGQPDSISKTITANFQSTTKVLPPATDGPSLPIIGGAVAAVVALVIVITVLTVCLCVRRKAQQNKVTDEVRRAGRSHQTPDVTVRDEPNLPGAAYHQYEEIPSQGNVVTPSGVIPVQHLPPGASAVLPGDRRYEKLRTTLKVDTPIDKWFKDRGIPKATAKKLKRHDVVTIQDLQDMSRADMVTVGLSVGEKNKIRRALKETATSQF